MAFCVYVWQSWKEFCFRVASLSSSHHHLLSLDCAHSARSASHAKKSVAAPLETGHTLHAGRSLSFASAISIDEFVDGSGKAPDPEVRHCSARNLLSSSGFDHHQPGAVRWESLHAFRSGKSYSITFNLEVPRICLVTGARYPKLWS